MVGSFSHGDSPAVLHQNFDFTGIVVRSCNSLFSRCVNFDFVAVVICYRVSLVSRRVIYCNMAERYTINMITPDTKNWTCKVQVVDKSRPRDNKDKTTKYQVLILQDEEENQVQATIFSTDITYFEKEFAPFKTYLVSVAYVKVPPLGYENPLNKFVWTLDKNTIVEPIEEVKPPEDPLPPPTRLTIAKFDTFEYQSKEFEFDVLAIVINGSPSTKTTTGKRLQEFIVMDKLKKPTKMTLWEDFIDHEGVKLFNQLHDYPIILARRIAKSSPGTSNRFVGLTSKFNTTIEINPPYPQAAELRTWIKTIEAKLLAYKTKSTTPLGSTMLIPFEDDIISVANIQAQPPGQIFNIEAELCLASKEQLFSVLACSNCKQLFTRYNVRREIYCTSCHRSTHLIPRCQFEVTVKDNSGFATAIVSDEIAEKMLHLTSEEIYEICFVKQGTLSLQNVEDQLNGKIFNIQMKKLFTKKLDATQKLSILSYLEKEDVVHEPMASTTVNVTEGKKRTIEHVNSREKEYPSIANKSNPPMKKN